MAGFGGVPSGFAKGPGPKPSGPPVPQPKSSKPAKPVQVAAHTRAAPTPKPNKGPARTPSAPVDPLLGQAQALANIQTQGPLTELQKQIAANNAQTTGTINQTGGFYNQLEPFVQSSVNQQGQIASGLNSTLAGIGQNTQSQLQGIGQGAMASLAKYAPGDNATAASGDLAAQIARQQGLAAQQAGTYQGFGANQGANYQGLGASQLGTFGLQGQEALRGIAQSGTVKNEPLVSKIAALQAQKGALTATDLGKLQQQQTSNQIAQAGLGIKTATLQNAAAQNQAKDQLIARGQNITGTNAANRNKIAANNQAFNQNPLAPGSPAWQRVQALSSKGWSSNPNAVGSPAWARVQTANARSKKGVGGAIASAKPLTTLENNTWNSKLSTVSQLIQDAQKQKVDSNGHPLTEAVIKDHLLTGANPAKTKFDGTMVEAAYELIGWGHITPQTARLLHAMGVRGGTFRNAPIRVAPPPSGVAQAVGQTGSTGALGSL